MAERDEPIDITADPGLTTDLVSFDAGAAVEAALGVEGGKVLLAVVYDTQDFEPIYASRAILDLYGSEAAMREHFGEIHAYVHLDFTERDMFDELFLGVEGVEAFVTYMGNFIAIRFMAGTDGLFFGTGPRADVSGVIEAVKATLE